ARVYVRGRVTLRAPGAGDVTRAPMREELGARVDPERVASLAREVRDGESALRRAHRGKHGALLLPIPVRVDGARAIATLLPIKDELDKNAVSARIDLETGKPIAEEVGRRV